MHMLYFSQVHFLRKDEVGKLIQICIYGKHHAFGGRTHEVLVLPQTPHTNLNKLHNIYF